MAGAATIAAEHVRRKWRLLQTSRTDEVGCVTLTPSPRDTHESVADVKPVGSVVALRHSSVFEPAFESKLFNILEQNYLTGLRTQ